jgi:hypothetical protein
VNVSINPLEETANMRLAFHTADMVPFPRPSTVPRQSSLEFSVYYNNTESRSNYSFTSSAVGYDPSGVGHVALGPRSALLRSAGSVALIRNEGNDSTTANLVIESQSLSLTFEPTCIPGSSLRLPWFRYGGVSLSVSVNNISVENASPLFFQSSRAFLILPTVIYTALRNSIEETGAFFSSPHTHNGTLSNCSEAMLESLAPINIEIPNIGTVKIYPDEYIGFSSSLSPDGGECELLVTQQADCPTCFGIDPLKLPNTNFRISNDDYWKICDSTT